jgi:large subunit ribosomal protein L21
VYVRAPPLRVNAPRIGKEQDVYAIVKTGGKQHKVAVGDLLEVERGLGQVGAQVNLPAVLLVEDGAITTDVAALAKVSVTAEVVAETKGPKIRIIKYKNKTGYRKRQGHRQHLLQVKITDIQKGAS